MTPASFDDHPDASLSPSRAKSSDFSQSMRKILRPIASLQVTVFLFVLSLMLVFFGTLAQINTGLWTVMETYFRSWHVWVPLQLFAEFFMVFFGLDKQTVWRGSFPFPSGNLLGFALLFNLLAAHAIRFRMTWKRSGIFLIHFGLIILMFGEFFTGQMAVESRMVLALGETANFIEDSRRVELAITEVRDDKKAHRTVTVPQHILEQVGVIRDEHLPVDIRVSEYQKNSDILDVQGGDDQDVIFSDSGHRLKIIPFREEPGVKSNREDAPMVRIEIFKKGTQESLGQIVLSLWQYRNYNRSLMPGILSFPKTFAVDGTKYAIELRNRRFNKNYSVELLKFEHKQHPGTKRAKEYASTVQLRDPENDEDREILIRMNHPLRYQGLTYYQSGVLPNDAGTVLQVVDNPVWILPYISCVVVAVGMTIHFGLALTNFQRRRAAA